MADHTAERTFRKLIERSGGLHGNIARDVWPNDAVLSCRTCGHAEPITTEQAGGYLSRGWPKHCGYTMTCEKAPAEPSDA